MWLLLNSAKTVSVSLVCTLLIIGLMCVSLARMSDGLIYDVLE